MNTGKLSVTRDTQQKVRVDRSELLRLGLLSNVPTHGQDTRGNQGTPVDTQRVQTLEQENTRLHEQVQDLRSDNEQLRVDRDEWRDQAKTLARALPPAVAQEPSPEGPATGESASRRSWWRRLLGG